MSFAVANLLNLEVDVLFFDTTSTCFELDDEDDPDDGAPSTVRRFGNSKDHRPDLPQVVVGLAVTRQGIPVRCWVWPNAVAFTAVAGESWGQSWDLAWSRAFSRSSSGSQLCAA